LRDKTDETPQRFHVDVFDVATIEEDLTSVGIIESANQTGNCRLSTSRQSNDGGELAGFAVDGDAVQNGMVRARRIRELDIAQGQFAIHFSRLLSRCGGVVNGWLRLDVLSQTSEGADRTTE